MVQKEANGTDGGTNRFGAFSTADTWYTRRLTTLLVNQSGTVTSFDGTGYTFTLSPGTYRISAIVLFNTATCGAGVGYRAGLWNVTTGTFEVFTGTTEPIISSTGYGVDTGTTKVESNRAVMLDGQFVVASSNKTYQIMQKTNGTGWGGSTSFAGGNDQMVGANVNGAAASQFYAIVKIGRES